MIIDENALQLLSEAINFCNSIKLYEFIYDINQDDSIEFSDFQIQNLAFTIDWNSKIELYRELDDCPEELCSTVNVKDFLALYSHINDYELVKNSIVYGKNMALFLVTGVDYYTIFRLMQDPIDTWCRSTIEVNNEEYVVEFISKRQAIFDLLLWKEKKCDYESSVAIDDYFIKVTSTNNLNKKIAEDLAEALIFELTTSHKIILAHNAIILDEDSERDSYNLAQDTSEQREKMFPLLIGKGISELLKLYNKAMEVNDVDYKILTFTKIIEYIAPTVIRKNLNKRVFQKLSSPTALSPNAEYVQELQKIFDENNLKYQKDSEMIKATILEIVDSDEIESKLPKFLKTDKKQDVLSTLSKAIANTRNHIAHAKSNYEAKDLECPEAEKQQFTAILKIVARQCIRWFNHKSEKDRITNR